MNTFLLLLFSFFLLQACLALSRRAMAGRDRVFWVMSTTVLVHVFIILPVHLLSAVNQLTVVPLAGAVFALTALSFIIVARQDGGAAALFDAQVSQTKHLLHWPLELFEECKRARLPLWPVVVGVGLLWIWYVATAPFSPPLGNNDALFYHEPIVAFTIQQHNIGPFDVDAHLQRINGVPRFCHHIQLWFAMFTGREHVEFANILAHPIVVIGLYGIMRKLNVERLTALLWAFSWPLMPGVVRLTAAIMVDVHGAALCTVAAYLVLVPQLSVARSFLAAFAIGLTVGTKYHIIVITFIFALALCIRLLVEHKHLSDGSLFTKRALRLTILGCASVVIGFVCLHYLRNLIVFGSPVWPWGVKSLGMNPARHMGIGFNGGKGMSFLEVAKRWTMSPFSTRAWLGGSARPEDYGVAGRYIVWPLGTLASAIAMVRGVQQWRATRTLAPATWRMLIIGCTTMVAFATFPNIVRGRYWLSIFGLFFVGTAWLLSGPIWRRLGRQVAFTASLLMLLSAIWKLPHGEQATPLQMIERLKVPKEERHFTARPLSYVQRLVGLARHKEQTSGKRVGFDSGFSIGIHWNDDYSNAVFNLKHRNTLETLKDADAKKVDWLFLHRRKLNKRQMEKFGWEVIGPALKRSGRRPGTMYRRVAPNSGAAVRPSNPKKKRTGSSLSEIRRRSEPGMDGIQIRRLGTAANRKGAFPPRANVVRRKSTHKEADKPASKVTP
ncbi:MAG: hypothetical protein GY822_09810 [Deltaproteobacteria bacterium]|nr:hypothetical protein [Deltaproteobacteria bacterium]